MDHEESRGTVWKHVAELRRYLIISAVSIVVCSLAAHFFYQEIVRIIFAPLGGQKAIFLSPLDPITFILKIDLTVGFIVSLPIIAWCIARFTAPALSRKMRRTLLVTLFVCSILSVIATIYMYYLIAPLMIRILTSINVPGTVYQITAQSYLSFILGQLLVSLLIFQTPLVIVLLTLTRLLNPHIITARRPLIYICTTVAMAILTPTSDLLSLSLVLIPTFVALEAGVLISRMIYNRRRND